jgi:DNA-binding NtrC family response regulator
MNSEKDSAPRVLVADDQADVREALRLLLKAEGCAVQTAASPAAALAALENGEFDAALIDLNYARDTTSGREGLDLLSRIQAMDGTLPVIVMTAWGTVELAVEAMRRGARDFFEKPWNNARVAAAVRTQVELSRTLRRSLRLEAENCLLRAEGRPIFIAESPAMKPVLELMARVGPSDANILITGGHGTGKEVVARALHAVSLRAAKPLVTVNVAGLAAALFESELFGHVKGAFTDAKTDRVGRFEMGDGGTLFLDEIANIPPALQAKLLRVVEAGEMERVGSSQTRRVDVRLVSATNADLRAEVAAGRFREDLLFRLNTVEIHLPPLRARKEDIPLLARHFLARYVERYAKPVAGFDEAAVEALASYPWPGNVRELDHVMERAVLLAARDRISAADLRLAVAAAPAPKIEEMSLEQMEQLLVEKALARAGGNISEAAKALGLSRSALYRRLEKHRR